jgi:hypothetical protein
MSQPDLKTTKRYYRSFMEWAQVCAPMQYMSMGLRTASKEDILGLIREWAETITRKDPWEGTRIMSDKIKNKESFVFYRSFYEAIQMLPSEDRLQIYDAISELALNGNQTETTGYASVVMKLVEPQILANNRKYDNACKGGRPKTKPKPNVNGNVNVNKNEKENGEGLDAFNNAIDFHKNSLEYYKGTIEEKPF